MITLTVHPWTRNDAGRSTVSQYRQMSAKLKTSNAKRGVDEMKCDPGWLRYGAISFRFRSVPANTLWEIKLKTTALRNRARQQADVGRGRS